MSLLCPHCHADQSSENHHCTELGCDLPVPTTLPESVTGLLELPVFRFAKPSPLMEEMPAGPPCPLPVIRPPTGIATGADLPVPSEHPAGYPFSWKFAAFSVLSILALVGFGVLGFTASKAAHTAAQAERSANVRTQPGIATGASSQPSAAMRPGLLPLTLRFQSSEAGRHIPLGASVVITAFISASPGQNADLSLSCQRLHGRKFMFAYVEGQLCSTRWTPTAPGRYQFTATAQDQYGHFAAAHPFWIYVNGIKHPPAPRTPHKSHGRRSHNPLFRPRQ